MPQYLLTNFLPDNFDPSTVDEATVHAIDMLNEAADMDEALAWARKAAIAGPVSGEVREIPYSSLPTGTPHPSRQRNP